VESRPGTRSGSDAGDSRVQGELALLEHRERRLEEAVTRAAGERRVDPAASVNNPSSPGTGRGGQSSGVPGKLLSDFGVRMLPMTEEVRQRLGLRPNDTGLTITEVTPDGIFAKAGFEKDLVILEANGQPVPTVEAFENTVKEAKAAQRSKILLAVRVGQATIYRTVDLPAG